LIPVGTPHAAIGDQPSWIDTCCAQCLARLIEATGTQNKAETPTWRCSIAFLLPKLATILGPPGTYLRRLKRSKSIVDTAINQLMSNFYKPKPNIGSF